MFPHLFCRFFFQNQLFNIKNFQEFDQSVSLDPDQVWHSVMPDMGSNYLQKLSADNTGR